MARIHKTGVETGKKLLSHRQRGTEVGPPTPWYGHSHQMTGSGLSCMNTWGPGQELEQPKGPSGAECAMSVEASQIFKM